MRFTAGFLVAFVGVALAADYGGCGEEQRCGFMCCRGSEVCVAEWCYPMNWISDALAQQPTAVPGGIIDGILSRIQNPDVLSSFVDEFAEIFTDGPTPSPVQPTTDPNAPVITDIFQTTIGFPTPDPTTTCDESTVTNIKTKTIGDPSAPPTISRDPTSQPTSQATEFLSSPTSEPASTNQPPSAAPEPPSSSPSQPSSSTRPTSSTVSEEPSSTVSESQTDEPTPTSETPDESATTDETEDEDSAGIAAYGVHVGACFLGVAGVLLGAL